MFNKSKQIFILLTSISFIAFISSTMAIERIKVSGHYVGVDMMLGSLFFNSADIKYFEPIFDGGGGGSESLNAQFCDKLASKQPGNCGLDPTSPDWAPNGCTTFGLGGGWDSYFNSACNAHDRCYSFVGSTQGGCDNYFRANMEIECIENPEGSPGKTSGECFRTAGKYYNGVDSIGAPFFAMAQSTGNCDGYHELRKKYCGG